jgi:hypothetical protein
VDSTAFTVVPRQRPYIFSYSPSWVRQGDSQTVVTVNGLRFGTTPGTITLLGTYTATVVTWTDTQIQFRIDPTTPPADPISVRVTSPQNGTYKEFGLFAVRP